MKLTQKERDKLWGEDGPYSQANLIIQERILDDEVSRIFLEVEVEVNPLTFEIIEKNRELFTDDPLIQQLLEYSEYWGNAFGYVTSAFSRHYVDESDMKDAQVSLEYARATIIKMHKYVMKVLGNLDSSLGFGFCIMIQQ